MPVALHHLRRDGVGCQAERAEHFLLEVWTQVRVRPYGAGELPHRDPGTRARQPLLRTTQLLIPD